MVFLGPDNSQPGSPGSPNLATCVCVPRDGGMQVCGHAAAAGPRDTWSPEVQATHCQMVFDGLCIMAEGIIALQILGNYRKYFEKLK